MRIVIITGLSGSGKSTAVRALEDEGFFCLDNLPVSLVTTFIELVEHSREDIKDVALVMDIRSRDFIKGYDQVFQAISSAGHSVKIFYFDATDEVLIRRFSETRRRHPALEGATVPEGIRFERDQLAGLRRIATAIIDTSEMNVHRLKELVIGLVKGGEGVLEMQVNLQSFGFRYGLPLESDLVMDVRFLPNPYFVATLRPMSGLDQGVRDYVMGHKETVVFLEHFRNMLELLLPSYRREGKSYLSVSIGCTGGRHRSVAIAEELYNYFRQRNVNIKITHRDIDKGLG
ncbi:RNase adapter protein RapZ [Citrifermentans bremense]|uniref:GlmZ(SRNA)-inactivating NTPase n=2 Tax=Geobacteraceae TaxID=213422 RepID=A0ABQ0MPM0_9BACT|nr:MULTISPECIES: RNase adapter RapZ [Geobacteraceae]BCG48511.1 RNase adapter protein RapZ [Citrifermentans bremense]GAW69026.1 glmZ(sRNA)-inactivating NTPase [Geoanaerobacter pelophilus]